MIISSTCKLEESPTGQIRVITITMTIWIKMILLIKQMRMHLWNNMFSQHSLHSIKILLIIKVLKIKTKG